MPPGTNSNRITSSWKDVELSFDLCGNTVSGIKVIKGELAAADQQVVAREIGASILQRWQQSGKPAGIRDQFIDFQKPCFIKTPTPLSLGLSHKRLYLQVCAGPCCSTLQPPAIHPHIVQLRRPHAERTVQWPGTGTSGGTGRDAEQ